MFNNFDLSDDEVLEIANQYENLINKYSRINGEIDEDLKQEIILNIYKSLTKNREKQKIFINLSES